MSQRPSREAGLNQDRRGYWLLSAVIRYTPTTTKSAAAREQPGVCEGAQRHAKPV
jgi:hypothetical protein